MSTYLAYITDSHLEYLHWNHMCTGSTRIPRGAEIQLFFHLYFCIWPTQCCGLSPKRQSHRLRRSSWTSPAARRRKLMKFHTPVSRETGSGLSYCGCMCVCMPFLVMLSLRELVWVQTVLQSELFWTALSLRGWFNLRIERENKKTQLNIWWTYISKNCFTEWMWIL